MVMNDIFLFILSHFSLNLENVGIIISSEWDRNGTGMAQISISLMLAEGRRLGEAQYS
jgi:hypothetical protein